MVVSALSEENGGGFIAIAPDLHGCMADGDTREAAIAELHHAIEEWIDEAQRLKRRVPLPGEYIARTRQERKEINNLLKAQEKLIKTQDRLLKEAKKEIEKIREGITNLFEQGGGDEKLYSAWSSETMPVLVAGVLSRRRQDGLPN